MKRYKPWAPSSPSPPPPPPRAKKEDFSGFHFSGEKDINTSTLALAEL